MEAQKLYLARCYSVVTASGAKTIQHEGLFSSHENALRYLVMRASGHTLEDDAQMEIIEFSLDIAEGREATAEWQYDGNARLLWSSQDAEPEAAAHTDADDVALLEGTVVKLLAWPWCVASDLHKEQLGVIEQVYENEDGEDGFQYTVAYVDEFGKLERFHPRSEQAMLPLGKEDWRGNATLEILSDWAKGEVEIPADLMAELEEGKACGRCLDTLVD